MKKEAQREEDKNKALNFSLPSSPPDCYTKTAKKPWMEAELLLLIGFWTVMVPRGSDGEHDAQMALLCPQGHAKHIQ